MSLHCRKCTKAIAGETLTCSDCQRNYHPGCIKHYLRYKTASQCCRQLDTDDMANSNPIPNTFNLPPSPFAQPAQAVTLESVFAFMKDSDARMSASIESQNQVINELRYQLKDIPELIHTVSSNSNRIAQLEQTSAQLRQEVSVLQSQLNRQPIIPKSELVMSGFPTNLPDSPINLAKKILIALGLGDLVNHVLAARELKKKNPSANATRATTSLVVVLTSNSVCDAIIGAKRSRRDLKISDALGMQAPGNIFVNELLPSDLYNLLRQTKTRAAQSHYKYVWVRNGTIRVRKDDGQSIIDINTPADLEKLV